MTKSLFENPFLLWQTICGLRLRQTSQKVLDVALRLRLRAFCSFSLSRLASRLPRDESGFRIGSKKILFITLSNIGDVVLTTPVLQRLLDRADRPQVSVMVGPKAAELFTADPAISDVFVYDKHASLTQRLAFLRTLRQKGFDEVVDLRNTLFPLLILGFRGVSSFMRGQEKNGGPSHAVLRHLRHAFGRDGVGIAGQGIRFHIPIPGEIENRIPQWLGPSTGPFIAIAPGAASDLKRWPLQRYARVAEKIIQEDLARVVLLGSEADKPLAEAMKAMLNASASHRTQALPIDLVGATSLIELAAVLKRCQLLISNDSGCMHMAAAIGTPVIAVFGPSDPARYGPFGQGHRVVRKDLSCSPCGKAQCRLGTHACMEDLAVDEVWDVLRLSLQVPKRCEAEHDAKAL